MTHLQILLKLDRMSRRQRHEQRVVEKMRSENTSGAGASPGAPGEVKTVAGDVKDIAAILPM